MISYESQLTLWQAQELIVALTTLTTTKSVKNGQFSQTWQITDN